MTAAADPATAERPRRRRSPWSLKSIVVDVTGKEIGEFQNGAPPARPRPTVVGAIPAEEFETVDPVDRVRPPLSRANGRRYHGADGEHHAATLDRHRALDGSANERPERIYLHYLLLHLDRLSLPQLWYLRRQVNDEIGERARPPKPRDDPAPSPAGP